MAGGSEAAALEGVDDIEWYALAHAYGVATDVPDLLRAVAAGDQPSATTALRTLADRLLHDDLAHTAAPAAAPFLVRIATTAANPVEIRAGTLLLLTDMAGAREGDPATARRLLAVLGRHQAELGALLDDAEPALRLASAGLAGRLVPPPAGWAPRLQRLGQDAGLPPLARAAYTVAAALADGRPPDRQDIARAADASFEVAVWRERELSGLLGLRISPATAGRLAAMLARLAVAEALEKK